MRRLEEQGRSDLHRRGSLNLPFPAVSLLCPSSLALVCPWCSLSGAVGALPFGASPLGGGRGVLVVVSVRCARVTQASRPREAALDTYPGRFVDGVRRRASVSPADRCSRSAPVYACFVPRNELRSGFGSCALRAARILHGRPRAPRECSTPEFRTARVGAGRGIALRGRRGVGASARAPHVTSLRVCSHSVLRNASRPRPLHVVSVHSASSMDRRSIDAFPG